jgi:hypothetical protein
MSTHNTDRTAVLALTVLADGNTDQARSCSPTLALRPSHGVWQRLLKGVAGMWMALVILSYIAVGYRQIRTMPDTASTLGLTRCGDSPCFRDLIPGQTLWSDDLPRRVTALDNALDPSHQNIALAPSYNGRRLGTISLLLPFSTGIRAGDVVRLYGSPCRVDIYSYARGGIVVLQYPDLYVQLDIIDSRLSPDTLVHFLFLRHPNADPPERKSDPCAFTLSNLETAQRALVPRPWLGFISLRSYLNTHALS